ncbi:SRPBCC family protein [Saccharomonospora cyanea]|uniref:Polyketide cyclase / dehydrase and lipid transport n=1 Tax=Saccharomonospora cyanea NA-134 TaxID=882082 RepID=H5XCM7_9PSEU|nr:SRPBCC family protein [Saccharomonospora cyanea]EHR61273.1 Polyketide cyclase / dehydrase and lipid transport [Saccharomonospora cyanea NA-134]
MIEVSRLMPVRPERVYEVLADGWTYAGWVVGNAHIRDVDAAWPAEGSRIHHKAGMWPLLVPDVSLVTAVDPGRMIELTARLWVLGRGRVRLTLTPEGDRGTRVTMGEEAVSGPAALLPAPVQALLLKPRNVEALARLEDIAVNRESRGQGRSRPGFASG